MKSAGAWGTISTLASSGGNALLIIAVSQLAADLETVAGFGVAQSLLILAFGTSRAAFGEALVVDQRSRPDRTDRGALAASVIAACVVGAIGLLSLPLFPRYVWPFLAIAAVGAPIILSQDTLRYVLFTRGQHRRAAEIDVVWAVLTLALTIVGIALSLRPEAIVIGWTILGLAVSAARARDHLRSVLDLGAGRRWLGSHRGDSTRLSIEAFAATAVVGIPPAVASFFAEPDVAVAARVLFAVFGIQQITYAIGLITFGLSDRSPVAASTRVALIGVVAAVVATVLVVITPEEWGEALFADAFEPARSIAIWFGIGQAAVSVANGALVGLRMLGEVKRTALTRTVASAAAALAASVGAASSGVAGYGYGIAVGFAAYAVAMTALLLQASRSPLGPTHTTFEGVSP